MGPYVVYHNRKEGRKGRWRLRRGLRVRLSLMLLNRAIDVEEQCAERVMLCRMGVTSRMGTVCIGDTQNFVSKALKGRNVCSIFSYLLLHGLTVFLSEVSLEVGVRRYETPMDITSKESEQRIPQKRRGTYSFPRIISFSRVYTAHPNPNPYVYLNLAPQMFSRRLCPHPIHPPRKLHPPRTQLSTNPSEGRTSERAAYTSGCDAGLAGL